MKRPFVVTRHGVSTGAPIQSVFAGCDFEGEEKVEKRRVREQLYQSMKKNNKNNKNKNTHENNNNKKNKKNEDGIMNTEE